MTAFTSVEKHWRDWRPTPTDPATLERLRLERAKYALECSIGYAKEALALEDTGWSWIANGLPQLKRALDDVDERLTRQTSTSTITMTNVAELRLAAAERAEGEVVNG